MNSHEIEQLKKAGAIAKEVRDFARAFIKKDMLLLEIADKIDEKILQLGAKPAFPVNLSINEIAAHATPAYNDTEKAHGLLKVDIGVHLDGYVADTATSIDLENTEENKKLILAAESALEKALAVVKKGVKISVIGAAIQQEILKHKCTPIQNLSGHEIKHYELHAGLTLPNIDNKSTKELDVGSYAIEPFTTTGFGAIRDGKSSGIYAVQKAGSVRDPTARDVLKFIIDEYKTLPFCTRWIYKKFGLRGLLALKRIEEAGILHPYAQLVEKNLAPVAQAEHTIIITQKEVIVTTK